MRRRRRELADLPPALMVFTGYEYRTAAEWMAAYDDWVDQRREWFTDRGVPEHAIPQGRVSGDCPFDRSLI